MTYIPKWKEGKVLAEEALTKTVAALSATGTNVAEIMRQTGLKRSQVVRIMNTDECKRYIREIGDTAIVTAKAEIKKEVARLAPLVIETLKEHLSQNNLQAIPHALKILGFSENESPVQDSNIQVVLNLGDDKTPKKHPDIEIEGVTVE